MAKIILDEQKVNDIVLPNIEKVLNKLKEVNTYAKKANSSLPRSSSSNILYTLNGITQKINNSEIQTRKAKQILIDKIDKTKRIESKSKQRIIDLSTSILKAVTNITSSRNKGITIKKEPRLVAKIIEQIQILKDHTYNEKYSLTAEMKELIENTYKQIIKKDYIHGKYTNKRFNISYGPEVPDNFAYNDDLVFKIYYSRNTQQLSDSDYIKNVREKKEFINKLRQEIEHEVKEKLDLTCTILTEKTNM